MTRDLDSLIRRAVPWSDEEALRPVREATRRELLERITATDPGPAEAGRRTPRRRRWVVAVPLAAGVGCALTVGALVAQPAGEPRSQASPSLRAFDPKPVAALSFVRRDRYIEVRIKDPLADPQRYRREFAEHGMKITLTLVPASPSVVGTIVMQDTESGSDQREIEVIEEGGCVTGGGVGCLRGLRIPVGYRNTASIAFGRQARPGETYDSTNSAFAPGEALHCLDIRGLTVKEAERRIRPRGVVAQLFHYDENNYGHNVTRDKIPDNWYVTDADPHAPGQLMLWVQEKRPTITRGSRHRALFAGCR